MVDKAAGVVIGVGLISTGSIAMAKPHWLGIDYMPGWHSLAEDNVFSSSSDYGESKFGKKYGRYLVGPTHKKDKPKETNKSWWDWSFRRLEKTRYGKFKGVSNGYGTDTIKDLNKVCEEAYKKETNGGLKGDGDSQIADTEFKKSDVWKYCSPGLLTNTDKDKALYSGKIGGEADNISKLVSVKDSSNDWFWKIRNEDFWSTVTSNNWSGSKATEENNKSIFKTEYETNSKSEKEKERKTIKDLCEQAYGEDKSSAGNKNNNDALKFCVLETSTT